MNMENVAKWNVHGEAVRTTNGVEAFHSTLSKECPFQCNLLVDYSVSIKSWQKPFLHFFSFT